jgi:predicted HAD superfamily phosphohydrolase YqeG
MTVLDLRNALGCDMLSGTDNTLANKVTGGYSGDLLSWVMGRAQAGDAWVTIMSNVNVAAVAALTDVACVILAEGVKPDAALLDRAVREELPLLCSKLPAYELCILIGRALE